MSAVGVEPLSGLSFVVVGIYYAPDVTGIAPYTTHLCETLARAGAKVTAVTGVPHYPAWRVPAEYAGRRLTWRERRNGVQVLRVRHFVPRRHDVLGRAMYEATFALGSRTVSRGLSADAVLAVTPNLGSVPAAAAIARRNDAPLGVVVQDLVGQAAAQSGVQGGGRVASVTGALEGRWISHARSVAVIDESFVPRLAALGVERDAIRLLPNFSHVRASDVSRNEARHRLGWATDRRIVLHSGNMGLKQHLENVVETARLASGALPDVDFVLVGDGSTRPALQALAGGLDNVRFVAPLSDREYPLALAAADCLLVNERPTVRDMSLPSKITSYLAAGRPIVAAVSADGATAAELARSGAAVRVDPGSPAALVGALRMLCDDDAATSALSEAGRQYAAARLGREAAEARIIAFVERLLAADLVPAP